MPISAKHFVAGNPRPRRRPILLSTLNDIMGGAEALSEIDFTRLTVVC
jgi:hypothetical protein